MLCQSHGRGLCRCTEKIDLHKVQRPADGSAQLASYSSSGPTRCFQLSVALSGIIATDLERKAVISVLSKDIVRKILGVKVGADPFGSCRLWNSGFGLCCVASAGQKGTRLQLVGIQTAKIALVGIHYPSNLFKKPSSASICRGVSNLQLEPITVSILCDASRPPH